MSTSAYKYGIKLLKQLQSQLELIESSFSQHKVHRIRLLFKRIHSLNNFLYFIYKDPKQKEVLKSFNKLYSKLGKLRDCQIQIEIAKNIAVNEIEERRSLIKWLNKKANSLSNEICKILKDINLKSIDSLIVFYREKSNLSIDIPKIGLQSFINQKLYLLKVNRRGVIEDNVFHSIRKNLKDIFYILDMIEKHDSNVSFNVNEIKRINCLQEELGRWNDWCSFSECLKRLNIRKLRFPEIEWIANVEKEKIGYSITINLSLFSGKEIRFIRN